MRFMRRACSRPFTNDTPDAHQLHTRAEISAGPGSSGSGGVRSLAGPTSGSSTWPPAEDFAWPHPHGVVTSIVIDSPNAHQRHTRTPGVFGSGGDSRCWARGLGMRPDTRPGEAPAAGRHASAGRTARPDNRVLDPERDMGNERCKTPDTTPQDRIAKGGTHEHQRDSRSQLEDKFNQTARQGPETTHAHATSCGRYTSRPW